MYHGCQTREQAQTWTAIGGMAVLAIAAVLWQILFGGAA